MRGSLLSSRASGFDAHQAAGAGVHSEQLHKGLSARCKRHPGCVCAASGLYVSCMRRQKWCRESLAGRPVLPLIYNRKPGAAELEAGVEPLRRLQLPASIAGLTGAAVSHRWPAHRRQVMHVSAEGRCNATGNARPAPCHPARDSPRVRRQCTRRQWCGSDRSGFWSPAPR